MGKNRWVTQWEGKKIQISSALVTETCEKATAKVHLVYGGKIDVLPGYEIPLNHKILFKIGSRLGILQRVIYMKGIKDSSI